MRSKEKKWAHVLAPSPLENNTDRQDLVWCVRLRSTLLGPFGWYSSLEERILVSFGFDGLIVGFNWILAQLNGTRGTATRYQVAVGVEIESKERHLERNGRWDVDQEIFLQISSSVVSSKGER